MGAARDDFAVDFDGAGAPQKSRVAQEVGDGARLRDLPANSVDGEDDHCEPYRMCIDRTFMPRLQTFRRRSAAILAAAALLGGIAGCSDPQYDTSTPYATVQSARAMMTDGRADLLPTLIHLQPREITYDDGVTEASAIADVREKTGEMLARLWRVGDKLRTRFPGEAQKEAAAATALTAGSRFGPVARRLLSDPQGLLDEQMARLQIDDLGDGTAAVSIDDEPAFGGVVMLTETGDGWRFTVPIDLARASGWWPDTREEWAVVAAMMLGIENSLRDFEREIDQGKFSSLRQASERAGRIVGESVAAQSIIYAFMKGKAQ